MHEDDQRRIIVNDFLPDVGANEEVSSEASTSRPCTSMSFSRSSSYASILSEIGPLQAAPPPKGKKEAGNQCQVRF